jgi:hypothetical protein
LCGRAALVGYSVRMELTDEPHDPNQWWFWTEEWQAGEREAEAEIARGEVERFTTAEDFLASLEQPK